MCRQAASIDRAWYAFCLVQCTPLYTSKQTNLQTPVHCCTCNDMRLLSLQVMQQAHAVMLASATLFPHYKSLCVYTCSHMVAVLLQAMQQPLVCRHAVRQDINSVIGDAASSCSGASLRHSVPCCLSHSPTVPSSAACQYHALLLWPCCAQRAASGPGHTPGNSPSQRWLYMLVGLTAMWHSCDHDACSQVETYSL